MTKFRCTKFDLGKWNFVERKNSMAETITVKIGYGQKNKTKPDLKNIFIKFLKKWIDVDPVISVKQKKNDKTKAFTLFDLGRIWLEELNKS